MSAPYTLPNNTQNLTAWGKWANTVTEGLWWNGVIVLLWLVIFLPLKERWGLGPSSTSASIVAGIVALLFRTIGWVSNFMLFIMLVLMAITTAASYLAE